MKKVLISDKMSQAGLDYLESRDALEIVYKPGLTRDELLLEVADAEGLIIRSGTKVTAEVLSAARELKVIGRAGIGVDNIDIPAATERGVLVMNTPDANATTTAELALAHILSLSRHLPQADASIREGRWERSKYVGAELSGKTLGVIGFGTIGRIVADRAVGLKMRVIAYDPFVTKEVYDRLGVEGAAFEEVLAASDYVTLHCPCNEKTRGLIGEAQIAQMKRGARLINCARGGLVDEAALCRALEDRHLAGAALDVYETEPPGDSPLLALDNIVFTPHLGASTAEAQVAVSTAIVRQVAAYLEEGEAVNGVNLPSMSAEELRRLGPYQLLAQRLGRLLSCLVAGPLNELSVTLYGQAAEVDTHPVAVEALVGLLGERLEGRVNSVNAAHLAALQGVSLVESRSEQARDYVSLITLTGRHGDRATTVSGALLGGRHPRLVEIDDIKVEAIPEGTMLVTRHDDQPGVIGALGTLLGGQSVNISRMQVGLDRKTGRAMAILGISDRLSREALDAVGRIPAVESVMQVSL